MEFVMLQVIVNGFVLGFVASPSCPSNAEEIRLGTRYHAGYALLVGMGAIAGDAIILVAVLLGLMPLLNAYPILNTGLWLAGSAVLFYVAWGIFREAASSANAWTVDNQRQITTSLLRAFWTGFAITTFNPFTVLWWVGLLAPLLETESIVIFSVMVLLGSLAWFVLLAGILHFSRKWLTQIFRRWVLVGSGLVVVGYALYFLVQAGRILR
jgi:threonine/homoserine/homoserine lactone efflux protein